MKAGSFLIIWYLGSTLNFPASTISLQSALFLAFSLQKSFARVEIYSTVVAAAWMAVVKLVSLASTCKVIST